MERDDLILALCREAGDIGNDEEILDGWEGNHYSCCGEEITQAAEGDVAALIHCRTCIGLPIFR